jgi:hypothetical protein
MTDYKYSWSTPGGSRTFSQAVQLLLDSTDVMASLRIDKARALEEPEIEWTTSMELAETLQREHRIPFRVGHHFASEVVLHARKNGLPPKAFPYAEAQRLYAEAVKSYRFNDTKLPLDEAAFRRTLSPSDGKAMRELAPASRPGRRCLQCRLRTVGHGTAELRHWDSAPRRPSHSGVSGGFGVSRSSQLHFILPGGRRRASDLPGRGTRSAYASDRCYYVDNRAARELAGDAMEQLGYQSESATWRNSYLLAAKELRSSATSSMPLGVSISPDVIAVLPLGSFLESLAIRV